MGRAEAIYRDIVTRQPDNPWGWLAMGELLGTDGRLQEAGNALLQVIALVPNHAPAYTLLGELALVSGQRGEAERCFTAALALDPHDSVAAAFFQPQKDGGGKKKKGAKL
jgi:predicted Zn-dependent protease